MAKQSEGKTPKTGSGKASKDAGKQKQWENFENQNDKLSSPNGEYEQEYSAIMTGFEQPRIPFSQAQ